jgi:lysophospholipase L1-like esterase
LHLRSPQLALLIGTLFAFIVGEALIRVIAPQPRTALLAGMGDDRLHARDPRYGWISVPHVRVKGDHNTDIEINALGFRDEAPPPVDRAAGELRLLVLGDSYVFGSGVAVQDSFPNILERRLREEFSQVAINVIPAGVIGYSTVQQELLFSDLRPLLNPDFVILTFVAGNDVDDNWLFDGRRSQGYKTPLGPIARRSHLARLLLKAAWPVTFFIDNRTPWRLAHTERLMQRLERRVREAGIPLHAVVIPARHQIRPGRQPGATFLLDLGLRRLLLAQNNWLIGHFVDAGVPYTDTLPPLMQADQQRSVIFDDDPHTNERGNEMIAEALYRDIEGPIRDLLSRRRASPSSVAVHRQHAP